MGFIGVRPERGKQESDSCAAILSLEDKKDREKQRTENSGSQTQADFRGGHLSDSGHVSGRGGARRSEQGYCIVLLCSVASASAAPWTVRSPPGSSVHGISQARILEWGAISFSRESSRPRGATHVSCISCIARQILGKNVVSKDDMFYRKDIRGGSLLSSMTGRSFKE